MLGNPEHPIAVKLTTTRRTMSAFKFDIPIPKTEAYKNSFIQQHLKTIRDEAKPRNIEQKINAAANKIKTTSTKPKSSSSKNQKSRVPNAEDNLRPSMESKCT